VALLTFAVRLAGVIRRPAGQSPGWLRRTRTRPTFPFMDDKTKTIDEHLARVDADRTPPASIPDHPQLPPEQDGPKGPEPTRFGDWEQKGRCTDF
jgi:hypothetical protein